MDELGVIEKLGIAKSSTIHSSVDKTLVSMIKFLKRMEKYGEIKIVVVHYHKGTKKLYMKDEIYRDYFN